jgi:hypothetical protein
MISEDKNLMEVSKAMYSSLQVVIEFMDKGIKGLLTGDLSVVVLHQI